MLSSSFSFGIGLNNIQFSDFPGLRCHKWVSWVSTVCHYDQICYVIYHCPVVNVIARVHLSWQLRIVSVYGC